MSAKDQLETAKRSKAGAGSWLTRAGNACDILSQRDLSQVRSRSMRMSLTIL